MLLLVAPLPPVAQAQKADKAQTSADLARVQERIRTLERQLKADSERRSVLDRDLRAAETAAARVRKELAAIGAERKALEAQRTALLQQMERQRAELDRQKAALGAQLRSAYMTGPGEPIRVVLGQQDSSLLGRHLTWSGYLARSRQALLASVKDSLVALAEGQATIERQSAELAVLETAQKKELAGLDEARRERAAVVAKLATENRDRDRELKRARQQAGDLERLVRELERALAGDRKPARTPEQGPPLGAGRWPVTGRVLADYGQPRAGGQLKWDGVLIAAPAGTPVKAVKDGRVVYADWLPGLGLLLVMDHGGGFLSLYGHNQDLLRGVGDRVAAGDEIAQVGDTGGQSQNALYFEVRRNGRPQNPRLWVK